jgi:hypothetical protein
MPTDNVDPDFFELEITSLQPARPTSECRIKTVQDLDRALAGVESAVQLALGVTACDADGGDMGSFWLFLNGDRAWIHLIEGLCFTARDPQATGRSQAIVEFKDDAGHIHRISTSDTVSREQGIEALRRWLPHGEKLPELEWDRA